jgi:sigma-B regulation protein RsbU (phosphoserine phosphatase)
VLGELNRILSPQIGAQLVSAAYLVLDPERGAASYSAAGHPPLLRFGRGKLERVESNGLPLGVLPEPEYPVCELRIEQGDRLLLYTDGVVEPENAKGEAFGDRKLGETIHRNCAKPPSEFVEELLGEIRRWRPDSLEQQDDITIVVIDVMTYGGAKPDAQAPKNQLSKAAAQGEVRE